ncbi:MAG: DNA polymerase III subunit delta [Bacteroidota bacterium]|nr:DNA polymerase III subunit delta [Bacteroidota bacterium]
MAEPKITHTQILAELKKKLYKPVYYLFGEENYFIDLISDYIQDHVLTEDEKAFNLSVLYGKDVDIITVIETAKRFPMMSDYQVVIVKEAQDLRISGEDKSNRFIHYLEHPQPTTLLVFCYKHGKPDKRLAYFKTLSKHAVVFESAKLYDNKIPEWITAYVKDNGYQLSPKAAILLAESLGTDLSRIVNETGKLFINLPKGSVISEDYIERNIGISKEYNVFELQNALGARDILKANKIINHLSANPKDNPLLVTVGLLFGFFNKLMIYHSLSDKSNSNAAKALGVNPFFVPDYMKAASNYKPEKLIRIVSYLREYDLRSKGVDNVSTTEADLLKELVFKILH